MPCRVRKACRFPNEQHALLQRTSIHPRDHLLVSLALGTGLRLSELVGLNVGDLYFPTGQPRQRVRVRAEIAKGGRAGDVFLPDAIVPKLAAPAGIRSRPAGCDSVCSDGLTLGTPRPFSRPGRRSTRSGLGRTSHLPEPSADHSKYRIHTSVLPLRFELNAIARSSADQSGS
jgi:integrase